MVFSTLFPIQHTLNWKKIENHLRQAHRETVRFLPASETALSRFVRLPSAKLAAEAGDRDDAFLRALKRLEATVFADARLARLASGLPDDLQDESCDDDDRESVSGACGLALIAADAARSAALFPWPLPSAEEYPSLNYYPLRATDFALRERERIALEERCLADALFVENARRCAGEQVAAEASGLAARERAAAIAEAHALKDAQRADDERQRCEREATLAHRRARSQRLTHNRAGISIST